MVFSDNYVGVALYKTNVPATEAGTTFLRDGFLVFKGLLERFQKDSWIIGFSTGTVDLVFSFGLLDHWFSKGTMDLVFLSDVGLVFLRTFGPGFSIGIWMF